MTRSFAHSLRLLRPWRHPGQAHGFTLLEVLLAVTIFSVCMAGIYASFRTSSRAFEHGRRSAEVMQTLRFTIDQITRDLRSVYYTTDYRQRLEKLEEELYDGTSSLLADQDEEQEEETELLPLGLSLNLHFQGTDGDGGDSIEFAHFVPSDGTYDNSFLGAERVRYFLNGTSLYRQRARVMTPIELAPEWREEVVRIRENRESLADALESGNPSAITITSEDMEANFFVEDEPLPPDLLARNVSRIDFAYGYHVDEWLEADDWNSDAKTYRTSALDLPEDDPAYQSALDAHNRRPNDEIPSYVRVRITVTDKALRKRKASAPKTHAIETIVWLPTARETHIPDPDAKEDRESGQTRGRFSGSSSGDGAAPGRGRWSNP